MFTVVNALLLLPLPFHDPDKLVALGEFDTRRDGAPIPSGNFSYPDFADVRSRNHSFEGLQAGLPAPRFVVDSDLTAP